MSLPALVLILALVQGITEFLPVSSSGHLVLFQHWLRFSHPPLIFDIVLHLGTLLAVLLFFAGRIGRLLCKPLQTENRRLILGLIIATIPTGLIGFFFQDFFESLFTSPRSLAIGFLITGTILLLSRHLRIGPYSYYLSAFLIGVCQGIAIVPGISRSGITVSACLILGFTFADAFEFSFLLSIPAILGAAVLELPKAAFSQQSLLPLALAFVVSAAFGLLALLLLRRLILRDRFHLFAWYCFPLALITFLLI